MLDEQLFGKKTQDSLQSSSQFWGSEKEKFKGPKHHKIRSTQEKDLGKMLI